jgi:hypothetical protein
MNRMFLRPPLLLLFFFVSGVSNAGIIIDGDPSDWTDIPALITDPAGDDATADIVSIKVANDENLVYFLLTFASPSAVPHVVLHLDTDLNPATGCTTAGIGAEYGIVLGTTRLSFIGDARDCPFTSSDFPDALIRAASEGFIEASVPISTLKILTPGLTAFDITVSEPDLTSIGRYTLVAEKPAIKIILDPPPTDNRYVIDATPTMPVIRARAKVISVKPDLTPTTTFTWTASLRINKKVPETCAIGDNVSFDKDIIQGVETTSDAVFTMEFKDPEAFRGGRLKLTAKATVNGEVLNGETPGGLSIQGANPQRADIQNNIDEQVPLDGFSKLETLDIQDVLKRIACRESIGQRQFDALANGGIGPVLTSCDNGVGIFQITSTNSCSDPFTKCRNTLFNWNANVTAGAQTYREKVQAAKGYPNKLKNSLAYQDFITNTINPQREASGLQPIPGFPTPKLTTDSLVGSDPPNQLLEDGVRGYNGFAGMAFGLALHEFIPDEEFLVSVPDNELKGLKNDPRVWRRVLSGERPDSGDPNYVNNVIAQSPQCGG